MANESVLAPGTTVVVPREPTEAMLRAALDARYQRSKRSQKVKAMFPDGYETWLRIGLKEDAPAIVLEYKAMLAAAPKLTASSPSCEAVEALRELFAAGVISTEELRHLERGIGTATRSGKAILAALAALKEHGNG